MPRLRLLPPVTTIYDDSTAARVLSYLMRRGGPIAIDTETNGLDKFRCRVLCWSMATEKERYFIPKEYLLFFEPLFRRPDITWILANAKFDMHMLNNMGVTLAGPKWDIIVMDAMDDDTRRHGLKEQSILAYDVRWGDFKELFLDPTYVANTLGLDKQTFTRFKTLDVGEKLLFVYDEQPQIVENYASCDAYFTYMRAMDLQTELAATLLPTDMVPEFQTLFDYFHTLEVPFTDCLWSIEREGVPVDMDYVKKIDAPMRDGIRAQERVIRDLAGPDYNPRSRDDLRDILYTKQGFGLTPVNYSTKGKTPTAGTGEKDLQILQSRVKTQKAYDFIEATLALGKLDKLHGGFVKNIHKKLSPLGRVHCTYNQAGTRTGRLSASDPNMQQLPTRNDPFHIRKMFVAPTGEKLLDFDYPQIQPRIAAMIAGEEKLMEDIRNGWDIHSANAANMYRTNFPETTYEAVEAAKKAKDSKARPLTDLEKALCKRRDGAKTVGLGALFGEGPKKMSFQLKIELDEAKDLLRTFFQTYPKIDALIKYMHNYGHETETTYSLLGRIRRLHKINNPYNFGQVAQEERIAFNNLIQASEMDMMKCAMLRIHNSKEFRQVGGRLCLQIHDELGSFAPADTAKEAFAIQKALMADPLNWGPIRIPLLVPVDPDGGIGDNLVEAH